LRQERQGAKSAKKKILALLAPWRSWRDSFELHSETIPSTHADSLISHLCWPALTTRAIQNKHEHLKQLLSRQRQFAVEVTAIFLGFYSLKQPDFRF
jgi:hypothetical protein